MLAVRNLEVVYDRVMVVLRDVSLEVADGTVVALLGANGAGKTTLLRAISGLLDLHGGAVTRGTITLDGQPVHRLKPATIVRRGVKHVLENRRIFAQLSVEENLRTGAHVNPSGLAANLERVFGLFPVLAERRRRTAGYLSGGEQQMLAIGRALMSNPRHLLLDEPSLGLAPRVVGQIGDLISEINRQKTSVLLVEQNAAMALSVADHVYVLETGRVVMDKPARELLGDREIREFYLGIQSGGATAPFRGAGRGTRHERRLS